ncbi:D-methionine transport system ATP-binding protein [Tamaricihabitans halophyticus]|uniref:D-methionine transport system ATP-binding protein n=1 Tax=Tamaricihabitans halophyticus TaxID=1262583 RepID=A0A4R2R3S9_9PSEU|nr:ATP-binding cassette domain-containing protein [Tamaricihabitans halophyticus]TCP56379.1 D-methionine transport system ATP-binding protein [Tamaricihabitans halophyticus]
MITVENLTKSFPTSTGSVRALREVSLSVSAGAVYGVLGAPGAGKSTLTQLLALRERPDSGVVRFDGVPTAGLSGKALRDVRGSLAVVDSAARFHPERTVAGNIAAPLEQSGMAGPERRDRVGTLLDLAGLTGRANELPGELSVGALRRAAVARALTSKPTVLFADDPTDGVPSAEQAAVLTVLDRARAELGSTVLVTTPDAGVIRRICEDVALLDGGAVVAEGALLDVGVDAEGTVAEALLPAIDTPASVGAGYDQVVDVVLIGFAAVGALLPEAASRFDTEVAVIGGGVTRFGDTPVARFRLGLRGERADGAVAWIADRGGAVKQARRGPRGVAA